MKELREEEANKIYGGDVGSITAPIINALVNVIKEIKGAGISLGSGIRRISENNLCPLE